MGYQEKGMKSFKVYLPAALISEYKNYTEMNGGKMGPYARRLILAAMDPEIGPKIEELIRRRSA